MKRDVVITGAGTAGLICAYKIAKNSKLSVLVIEKEAVPGKKLKAAGSGKCNITNSLYDCQRYNSDSKELLDSFLIKNSYKDILQLLEELGICYYEQNGYYYPLSNQGKQVVHLIYQRCLEVGVEFLFDATVHGITSLNQGYKVAYTLNQKTFEVRCNSLVVATGGKAAPKLGGCESGYDLLKPFRITMTKLYPGLCPIYMEDPLLKLAKGVRVNGTVSLKHINGTIYKEKGQIQFNQDSVSGICVMNLSGLFYSFAENHEIKEVFLDLMPEISWDGVKQILINHRKLFQTEDILTCLEALMPEGLCLYILARCGYSKDMRMDVLKEKEINKLTSTMKKLNCNYINRMDYDKAQVTCGGVSLEEIDPLKFSSKKQEHLYIVGELLDVYGQCGGYNITFAMLSGMAAAKDICENEDCL